MTPAESRVPISKPNISDVPIHCADGTTLAGRLFRPRDSNPSGIILLHGATGVPRDYYGRFAHWLADHRRAVILTYDYRDCGHSARVSVKSALSDMGDWGVKDQGAALDAAVKLFPDLPLEVIGHSLGGMFLPYHDKAHRVVRLTSVAAGPAYWTRHPLRFIPKVLLFWFLAGPLVATLSGYMPGRLFGLGADLPGPVYWQWRRWCTSRRFKRVDWGKSLPRPDLERVTCPVRLVSLSDDPMIPPAVVRDLAQYYPKAAVEHHTITPKEAGVDAIGHLRIFSERCKAAWPLLVGEPA